MASLMMDAHVGGSHRLGELELSLSDIEWTDSTFRMRVDPLDGHLEEQLRRNGQRVSIIARRRGASYQIVSGFRRVAALASLGARTVRAIVRDDLTEASAYALALRENFRSRSLNDVELARAIIEYRRRYQLTISDVLNVVPLGRRQVHRLCRLTTFPLTVQNAIETGRLPTTHAIELMKALGPHPSGDELRSWLTRIETHRVSLRLLRAWLDSSEQELAMDAGPSIELPSPVVSPARMSAAERQEMRLKLQQALDLLNRWPG